jgi:hypothetical protein
MIKRSHVYHYILKYLSEIWNSCSSSSGIRLLAGKDKTYIYIYIYIILLDNEKINALLKGEDIVKIYQVTENKMVGACRKNGR